MTVNVLDRHRSSGPSLRTMLGLARPDLIDPTDLDSTLDTEEWARFLRGVEAERVSGLLWAAVEAGFGVTPLQQVEAAQLHHASMAMQAKLEATATWVIDLLQDAGIDVRIIKGLATGHLVHPRVEHRDSGDIDLLVEPSEFAEAIRTLEQAGIERGGSWGQGTDVFAKEVVFVVGDVEIDLHQSLAYGQRWRRATPELMQHGLPVRRHQGSCHRTLSLEGLFISACVSAAGTDARLTGWLDIATISRHHDLNPERLRSLVDEIGCASLIEPVASAASELLSVEPGILTALRSIPDRRLDRFRTNLETGDGGIRFVYSCLSGHPRTWPRGLRTLVQPDEAYFRAEGRDPADNWRRIHHRTTELLRLPRALFGPTH